MHTHFKHLAILLLFACSLSVNTLHGQANNNAPFKLRHKIKDNKVMLRICPADGTIWELGNKYGYQVEKFLLNNDGTSALVKTFALKPTEYDGWQKYADTSDYFLGARRLIYYDRVDPAEQEADLPSEEYTEQEKKDIRYDFACIGINSSFTMAQMAGLGLEELYENPEDKLQYKVTLHTPAKKYEQSTIIQPAEFVPPVPPSIKVLGNDNYIDIQWPTKDAKWDFYSYHLELSDDSLNFRKKFELPYLDISDTVSHIEAKNFITLVDSTDANYKTRWYRIKGVDFFGDHSKPSPVVAGHGIDLIQIAPFFTDGIQTDSNYAVLKWEVQEADKHLVDHFVLSHADSVDATYKQVTKLPADARTFTAKMQYASNYFILTTIPKDGMAIHSYPVMVMAYDADPPHKPLGVEGTIDTNGIVNLTWNANTDEDIKGYEVFKKDFETSEFYQVSTRTVLDTTFADTLSLALSTDQVYYTIAALDQRHNQSIFSDTIKLKKPDIHPPVEPHIYNIDTRKDTIILQWHNSPSQDAVLHQLFRRQIPKEEGWTLLGNFDNKEQINEYMDTDVVAKNSYAYILTATDDDGLTSEPSQPVVTKPADYGSRPEVKNFRATTAAKENKATLSWEYDDPDVFEFWLYKKRVGGNLSLYKKLNPEVSNITEENLAKNSRHEYYLKAVFRDGTNSPFSEKLLVEIKGE